jgi:conjugative transposon TraK protein
MFPKTQNLDSSFQHIRLFCIVVIVFCFSADGFITWQAFRMVERAQGKIYILSSGKALEAFASDRKENTPVEARDHIRSFHQYFFSLDPDEKVITANITRSLYLADGSAKRLYDNLKENGYYAGIISGNISQEITVDSIDLDMKDYPYHFRCYATQKIIRPTSLVTRDLITEGWLRNTSRSDNDPHGFLIERWVTLENKDLKVESR